MNRRLVVLLIDNNLSIDFVCVGKWRVGERNVAVVHVGSRARMSRSWRNDVPNLLLMIFTRSPPPRSVVDQFAPRLRLVAKRKLLELASSVAPNGAQVRDLFACLCAQILIILRPISVAESSNCFGKKKMWILIVCELQIVSVI